MRSRRSRRLAEVGGSGIAQANPNGRPTLGEAKAMDEWLSRARDTLATAAAIPRSELELTENAVTTVLELAAFAAHESGERTNAPLLCYLLGKAEHTNADLATLAAALRETDAA
jgi:hypothetical protein